MEHAQDEEALRVQLLGQFRVWVGERLVPESGWRRRKAAHILKLLASTPEHRVHREMLLEWLWPESNPESAENNLHQTLHVLRHTVDPYSGSRARSPYLALHGDLLTLCPGAPLQVDVDAFVAASDAARRTHEPALHQAAIDRYTGDLLPEDPYEEWVMERRAELRQMYHDHLRALARLQEALGAYEAAIEVLQQLVRSNGAEEGAYADLMRLYALLGRRHEALLHYERLATTLRQEVNAEPDPTTRRLVADIRAGRLQSRSSPVLPGHASIQDSAAVIQQEPAAAASDQTKRVRAGGDGPTSSIPTNLSHAPTSFIGREQETTEITRLLSTSGLLTLTGAGGIGKSRLAAQVAFGLLPAFMDGVWLVQLASVTDARMVPRTVAGVLGVRERRDRTLTEAVVDSLSARHVLLVLDNCEHLLPACTELVEELLHNCSRLSILATSRKALGAPGEGIWRVPSMAVPEPEDAAVLDSLCSSDAVSLFLERTRTARPEFRLTPHTAPAVVEVCRRLDGIPLAIELAAARMRVLTVEQIAARLDDCFAILGSSASVVSKHRTLRATMDWSHRLLSKPEQVVLRRLAVFAGSWTLEGAERVCSGEGIERSEVLEHLSALVDHSLVLVAKHGISMRYRMLEPVRQYAGRMLRNAGEERTVRERHAVWSLALAESAASRLIGLEQVETLEQMELEHDNLRAALTWLADHEPVDRGLRLAGALWRFWWLRGHWSDGRHWLELMLARGEQEETLRAKALSGAGVLAYSQGDVARAARMHEDALALYRAVGDVAGVAAALNDLGRVTHYRADFQGAAALYTESLTLRRELDDEPAIALSLLNLASAERDQGNYDRAILLLEESLELYRQLKDSWGIAFALNDLGRVARIRGEYQQGQMLYERSLQLYRRVGDTRGIAIALNNLGNLLQEQGDLERAEELHQECLRLYEELGDEWGIAAALHHLAHDGYQRADYRRAHELAEESLRLRRRFGDAWGTAHTLLTLARLTRAEGEHERALSLYGEALLLYRRVGDRVGLAACLEGLADLMREAGDVVQAVRVSGAAASLRAALGAPLPLIDRPAHERSIREMRGIVGAQRFAVAWRRGQEASPDQIVGELLSRDSVAEVGRPLSVEQATEESTHLSPREHEIVALVAQEFTNAQIATQLEMSERTAAAHVHNILKTLRFSSRRQVAEWVRSHDSARVRIG